MSEFNIYMTFGLIYTFCAILALAFIFTGEFITRVVLFGRILRRFREYDSILVSRSAGGVTGKSLPAVANSQLSQAWTINPNNSDIEQRRVSVVMYDCGVLTFHVNLAARTLRNLMVTFFLGTIASIGKAWAQTSNFPFKPVDAGSEGIFSVLAAGFANLGIIFVRDWPLLEIPAFVAALVVIWYVRKMHLEAV